MAAELLVKKASAPQTTPPRSGEGAGWRGSPPSALGLEPTGWLWATWRPWTPLPRPEPVPFDREACLARLAGVSKASTEGWRLFVSHAWDWSSAAIQPSLSREEAHFWFAAMARLGSGRRRVMPESVAEDLRSEAFDGDLTFDEVLREFERTHRAFPPELMAVLTS